MSEVIIRSSGGHEYTFVCEYRNSRSGFSHLCDLYEDGYPVARYKAHYLNRTWETYRYQTVMIGAVNNLIETNKRALKELFCEQHGYKKLTEKRREELNEVYVCDPKIKRLEELKNRLRNDKYGSEREREELESLDRLVKFTEALASLGMFKNN